MPAPLLGVASPVCFGGADLPAVELGRLGELVERPTMNPPRRIHRRYQSLFMHCSPWLVLSRVEGPPPRGTGSNEAVRVSSAFPSASSAFSAVSRCQRISPLAWGTGGGGKILLGSQVGMW